MTKINPITHPQHWRGPPRAFSRSVALMAKWHELYFSPVFVGYDKIPADDTRLLFVGYHTLMAYDYPYLWHRLRKDRKLTLRALTDKYIFAAPGAGMALASTMGHVEGSRENCRTLMAAGKTLAVYPGGSREALHPKNQAHTMDWGSRDGFVRMALEFGYTIVPFAVVGVDDQWDYLMDGQEFAASPLGRYLKKTGIVNRDDLFPPIFRSLWPRPNRHFYGFADPVALPRLEVHEQDDATVKQYRDRVVSEVDGLLADLQKLREETPDNRLLARFTRHR